MLVLLCTVCEQEEWGCGGILPKMRKCNDNEKLFLFYPSLYFVSHNHSVVINVVITPSCSHRLEAGPSCNRYNIITSFPSSQLCRKVLDSPLCLCTCAHTHMLCAPHLSRSFDPFSPSNLLITPTLMVRHFIFSIPIRLVCVQS